MQMNMLESKFEDRGRKANSYFALIDILKLICRQQQYNSIGCYLSKCNVKYVSIQIKTASCKTCAVFDVCEKKKHSLIFEFASI